MDARDKLAAVGVGALGGGIAAFIVWQAVKSQVDAQVQTSVRAAVDSEIDHKMSEIGLNAQVAANLRTLIENLDRLQVFSALAQGTAPR